MKSKYTLSKGVIRSCKDLDSRLRCLNFSWGTFGRYWLTWGGAVA